MFCCFVVNMRNLIKNQVVIGMDVASSEFHTDDGMYDLDFKVCVRECLHSVWAHGAVTTSSL